LIRIHKSITFYLIDRLIHHILTLFVFTTTTKRLFSTIKIAKTRLLNGMEDEFLIDNMCFYMKNEIVENFSFNLIVNKFNNLKNIITILYM